MAHYKVLQVWRNKYTNEVYKKDAEIELTVKRADEAIENLRKHDGEFLKRLDNPETEEVTKTKEVKSKGKK